MIILAPLGLAEAPGMHLCTGDKGGQQTLSFFFILVFQVLAASSVHSWDFIVASLQVPDSQDGRPRQPQPRLRWQPGHKDL